MLAKERQARTDMEYDPSKFLATFATQESALTRRKIRKAKLLKQENMDSEKGECFS